MVATRSQCAAHVKSILDIFPDELWLEVLSSLRGKDLGRVACVSRKFASLREHAWQAACSKRWPQWYQLARAPETLWRRQYELLELREREETAVPSVSKIKQLQKAVNARHRTVLTEWLAEVSWDWGLDSVVVFKAINYLDHHLALHKIDVLARFQLVGLACLRAAMSDNSVKLPVKESAKELDPQRFAYISDRTYTPAQVEELTAVILIETPVHVRTAPNAKMFLRSFWYRAVMAGLLSSEEMHLYTVASFYLQLGLLDLECSAFPASCMAAAALSNALETFGMAGWFPALQHYSAYTAEQLQPCKQKQRAAQATLAAEHLRQIWRVHHENHGYDEYRMEWAKALLLIACPSK